MLRIALLQILPTGSKEGNLKKGVEACRKAKALRADIALFPEMWSNGYQIPECMEALKGMAVSADGAFVSAFGELAAKLDLAIAITFLKRPGVCPETACPCLTGMESACILTLRYIPAILERNAAWSGERTFMCRNWIPGKARFRLAA